MGSFDRLWREVDQRSRVEGVSPVALLDLPEPLRSATTRLMRIGTMTLSELAADLSLERSQAHHLGELLVDKGILSAAPEGPDGEIVYRLRLAHTRRRVLPVGVWQALGDVLPQAPLPELLKQMLQPRFYPHPVAEPIQVIQTHISYLVLTGDYAYKIKKPVDFGFLDYSTLRKRQHFCQQELRLNRRLSPSIYLEVVPIARAADGTYELTAGSGQAVEYALRMRQFSQEQLFSRLIERGELDHAHVAELGQRIAAFHRVAVTNGRVQQFGSASDLRRISDEHYAATVRYIGRGQTRDQFEQTRSFKEDRIHFHGSLIEQRRRAGSVRECHGDLHLENVCIYRGDVQAFDCIEFNEEFSNIDVLYDLAFMMMDLESRGRRDLAYAFVNEYLDHTGDYRGAVLLPLYCCIRAYIRAMVTSFLLDDPNVPETSRAGAQPRAAAYYRLAWSYSRTDRGRLLLVIGPPGAGTSPVARYLCERLGAIHLRFDRLARHLEGLAPPLREEACLPTAVVERVYGHLLDLGLSLVREGMPVVLEASYGRRAFRSPLIARARADGVSLQVFACCEPGRGWQDGPDDPAAPAEQMAEDSPADPWPAQPFTPEERALVLRLDPTGDWRREVAAWVEAIQHD